MESGIERLDVRAAAHEEVADAARRLTPQFARRVLTRCDELLDERAPGRCIVMRRLDTRWRLLVERLDEQTEVDAVAAALADGIEREVAAAGTAGSDDIVSFENEIEYRADYLAAIATGRAGAWCFRPLKDEGSPLGALAGLGPPALAEAVLVRLADRGALESTLAALGPKNLETLATAVGAADLVASLSGGQSPADPEPPAAAVQPQPFGAFPSSASVMAARILCVIQARRMSAPGASISTVKVAAERLLGRFLRDQQCDHDASQPDPLSAPKLTPGDFVEGFPSAAPIETRFGGLFYLLDRALELSLGEIVWKACLPEQVFFARLALALTGAAADGDPAPRLFGGAAGDLACDRIDLDRLDEMTIEMARALANALPRRALATWPRIEWCVAETSSGRLLMAGAAGTDFPLFAWPAASGSAIETGMRRFLAAWPAGAPPQTAHPALAEADRSGRVIADVRVPLSRPLLVAAAEDRGYTAALTQAAGSLAYLFAARTGASDLRSCATLVERHLSVPARIRRTTDELVVRMPAGCIDLSLRRAGLDRDPGRVPWLRASVRFEYDEACEPDEA